MIDLVYFKNLIFLNNNYNTINKNHTKYKITCFCKTQRNMLRFGKNYTPKKLYKRLDEVDVVREVEDEGREEIAKRDRRVELISLRIQSEQKQKYTQSLFDESTAQDSSPGAAGSSRNRYNNSLATSSSKDNSPSAPGARRAGQYHHRVDSDGSVKKGQIIFQPIEEEAPGVTAREAESEDEFDGRFNFKSGRVLKTPPASPKNHDKQSSPNSGALVDFKEYKKVYRRCQKLCKLIREHERTVSEQEGIAA